MGGELVSGSYFPTLGLQPAAGRLLTPADDATPGAHPVVVLSHGYWTSRFAQDPSIVGQPIVVNNSALTVVGVAPPGFEGTTLGLRPGLFVPLSMRGVMQPGWEGFEDRRRYWVYVFGRLKPGVAIAQAQAALECARHPPRCRSAPADGHERPDAPALQGEVPRADAGAERAEQRG